MNGAFATVRTVGANLPSDVLTRVVAGGSDLPGLTPKDYRPEARETPREAANRAWSYLLGTWASFKASLDRLPEGDPAVGLTRDKWLAPLFRELDFGHLEHTPAGGLVVGGRAFGVSHLWQQHTPIHLLGWGVDLDRRTPGVPGAAGRAPQAMLQELLNRADEYLWGVLTNGRTLRLLRDSTSLVGQSYVEFDLEAMFDGEVFSDFVLLFLLAHQSRFRVLTENGPASDCWLERWRTHAAESGTRALGLLRLGVKSAIETLGTGFLRHPDNRDLTARLSDGHLTVEDYHRALLRLTYRLLFLFVAEDRDALLHPGADPVARRRYADYYSTAHLRRLAQRRRGTRHGDLWHAVSLVLDALGREDGRPELGLPGLGGIFDSGPTDVLVDFALPNDALLGAVRSLSVVQPQGQPRRTVDYLNLGAEELGGIYESLLEYVPRLDAVQRTFTLEVLAGNERKKSGSYYTPTALIDLVLDTALDPLLDRADATPDPTTALLGMTVCDPACGSGHFLVAAARRIAERLATARTGDTDPTPTDLQAAMHDVVARCIYGVDINPMAAELAKVSLWLEALQPGRPLSFLDAHIKVGNSLLGTTPALLAAGIPDAAFTALEGDDKKHALALKNRNATERDTAGQGELFDVTTVNPGNRALRDELTRISATQTLSLADVHLAKQRFRALEDSPAMRQAVFEADAWCAAFVQTKTPGARAITQTTLTTPLAHLDPEIVAEVGRIAARHRFFHWHLEFPEVFDVSDGGASDTQTGWRGGFEFVVGNPPWETLQMSEKEFFASRSPEITHAANAAKRKEMIAALADSDPALFEEFTVESRRGSAETLLIRASDRYPLTARGKINTYSLFAETFRAVIRHDGRMGIITPTGLATGDTNSVFFADTIRSGRLVCVYEIANHKSHHFAIGGQSWFALSVMTGGERVGPLRVAFDLTSAAAVRQDAFELEAEEVLVLNPNTGTLPVLRSRVDAEITLRIYRRHQILIRDGSVGGNPWELSFSQGLFNMASDSKLFRTPRDLESEFAVFDGWAWVRGRERWVPLYEGKMLAHWDHRFGTYAGMRLTPGQQVRALNRLSDGERNDPYCESLSRSWINESEVLGSLKERWTRGWLFGWRDITNTTNERTFVPSVLPRSAVGHVFPIAFPARPDHGPLLQALWSSLVCDYVTRQKLSGTHLTYGVLNQIACPTPSTFAEPVPWQPQITLAEFVTPRVLELTYTSHRIAPYARDLGDDGPPFRWYPERRDALRAELDAALCHIYGLTHPEVEHVLASFDTLARRELSEHGEFRTRRLVLERYDAMRAAIDTGVAYTSPLAPPPGHGPRHPRSDAPR